MNRRKLLLKGYNFEESKHDRFGKRPAANAAEKIDERSTEADVSAFRRSIWLFFFFYDRLRTLDLRFLLWMYLASILLERFQSAQQKAITFFAAHLAESSLREELACGPPIELLHRSCNWLKLTERAARFPARASCAGSKVGAEKFAWACNPTRYVCACVCVCACVATLLMRVHAHVTFIYPKSAWLPSASPHWDNDCQLLSSKPFHGL